MVRSIQPSEGRLRWIGNEGEGVLGDPGKERNRLTECPGVEARAKIRRERMAALAAGHMEICFVLVARGHPEALRGAEARTNDPRHVLVTRQRFDGHVDQRAEPRQGARQRVPDSYHIGPPQSAVAEPRSFGIQRGDGGIRGGQQEFSPARRIRRQQVRRLLLEQRPQRPFE